MYKLQTKKFLNDDDDRSFEKLREYLNFNERYL